MSIATLIQEITPLYNKYRNSKNDISGTEALEIMWDIGDILKKYIERSNIAPHNLFWSVYGNAEGTKNIEKKSYITREFQNRCHRIRRIFPERQSIRKDFSCLKSFTTFREAMPFLDEGKYRLEGEERKNLITLLNSNSQPIKILEKIKILQNKKIGIKNPRTQRLHEVENEKQVFINFYNLIYNLTKQNDYKACLKEIKNIDFEYWQVLSKNTSALSQEGLKFYDFEIPANLESLWKEYGEIIKKLIAKKDPKARRRFRRLIPVERLLRLADMLSSLTSEENFKSFKKRG